MTWLQFWGVYWSYYRWLLFGGLLAMSALGLFLLYPLVFLRGLLLGFSFSTLFTQGSRIQVFLHFSSPHCLPVRRCCWWPPPGWSGGERAAPQPAGG